MSSKEKINSKINKLTEERQALNASADRLTKKIKVERERLADEKRELSGAKSKAYLSGLAKENIRLRGVLAVFYKSNGLTYDNVGELLNISGGSAKKMIERSLRSLSRETPEEDERMLEHLERVSIQSLNTADISIGDDGFSVRVSLCNRGGIVSSKLVRLSRESLSNEQSTRTLQSAREYVKLLERVTGSSKSSG